MRYFQSHEFMNCCFLPIANANKNSKWVWGIAVFHVTVYKSQNLFVLVPRWLAYSKVLGCKVLAEGNWCWGIILEKPLRAGHRAQVIFSWALVCSSCCVFHKPPSLSSLCSVLSPLLAAWGIEEAGCLWNLILLEVGVAELQKACQQTKGIRLV